MRARTGLAPGLSAGPSQPHPAARRQTAVTALQGVRSPAMRPCRFRRGSAYRERPASFPARSTAGDRADEKEVRWRTRDPRRSRWSTRSASGLAGSEAAVLTEYRGSQRRRHLDPAPIAARRRWRLQDLQEHAGALRGPRSRPRDRGAAHRSHRHRLRPDDGAGDPVPVAKALSDFARATTNLVVKGGVLGDKVLSADDTQALADVAPREELLARLAGAMAAPMQQFAGLLEALPRNFAYGLPGPHRAAGWRPEASSAPERPPRPVDRRRPTRLPPRLTPGAEATGETRPPPQPTTRRPPPMNRRPTGSRDRRNRDPRGEAAEPPRRTTDHGYQGRHPRLHRQHDRARAQRAPEGVRGEVRRDRRGPRGRGRGRRRWWRWRREAAEEQDEFDVVLDRRR